MKNHTPSETNGTWNNSSKKFFFLVLTTRRWSEDHLATNHMKDFWWKSFKITKKGEKWVKNGDFRVEMTFFCVKTSKNGRKINFWAFSAHVKLWTLMFFWKLSFRAFRICQKIWNWLKTREEITVNMRVRHPWNLTIFHEKCPKNQKFWKVVKKIMIALQMKSNVLAWSNVGVSDHMSPWCRCETKIILCLQRRGASPGRLHTP